MRGISDLVMSSAHFFYFRIDKWMISFQEKEDMPFYIDHDKTLLEHDNKTAELNKPV